MIYHNRRIPVSSTKPIELIDITDEVKALVRKSGLVNGFVLVASRHTTASIRINEDCPELKKDIVEFLQRTVDSKRNYRHNRAASDGRLNAHSHLLSTLLGSSETIAVSGGEILLGSWQKIFFIELDGPRKSREVGVTVIGE